LSSSAYFTSVEIEVSVPGCILTTSEVDGPTVAVTQSANSGIIIEKMSNTLSATLQCNLETEVWMLNNGNVVEYISGGTITFDDITIEIAKDPAVWGEGGGSHTLLGGVRCQRHINSSTSKDNAVSWPHYSEPGEGTVQQAAGYVRYFTGTFQNDFILWHLKYVIEPTPTKLAWVDGVHWSPNDGGSFSFGSFGPFYGGSTSAVTSLNCDNLGSNPPQETWNTTYIIENDFELAAYKAVQHPHTQYLSSGGFRGVPYTGMTVYDCHGDQLLLCGNPTPGGFGYYSELRCIAYNAHTGFYNVAGRTGAQSACLDVDSDGVLDEVKKRKSRHGVSAAWNPSHTVKAVLSSEMDEKLYIHEFAYLPSLTNPSKRVVRARTRELLHDNGYSPSVVALPSGEWSLSYVLMQLNEATATPIEEFYVYHSRWDKERGERIVQQIIEGTLVTHCRDAKGRFVFMIYADDFWHVVVGTLNDNNKELVFSEPRQVVAGDGSQGHIEALPDGSLQFTYGATGAITVRVCRQLNSDGTGTWS
jgi:hypothetical protein